LTGVFEKAQPQQFGARQAIQAAPFLRRLDGQTTMDFRRHANQELAAEMAG
jgi:hypothetical protein